MVTTNGQTSQAFTLRITQRKAGPILVSIERKDGESRTYLLNQSKLAFFTATNNDVRDAVDFLLGDA